jgi:uncharacterized protein (TIGR03118 family)
MKRVILKALQPSVTGSFIFILMFLLVAPGCQKVLDEIDHFKDEQTKLPGDYRQINLVANNNAYSGARVDSLLINAWGIAFSPGGVAWVNSQGGGVSALYNGEGAEVRAAVHVPSPGGNSGGNPTGIAFNGSNSDFILSNGQAARFLFVGVDGIVSGWNGPAGDTALVIANNSATAAYTGVAVATEGGEQYLYAANFRTGKIDVWNRTFDVVTDKKFIDPYLPAGYAPFNIRSIGDKLYVMYALVGPNGRDVPGIGNGYVNIFDTDGNLLRRFASKGLLNAPWGVAEAPAGFFEDNAQGGVLIGNFGDGRINAYSHDGRFLGQLRMDDKTLEIEGLWEITFAPATATTIDPNRLYFAAGPEREEDGLFGYIIKR